MKTTFLRVALASAMLMICADAAWAQRTSTMQERLFFAYEADPTLGHVIGYRKAATVQQCRDLCLAENRCRYWEWIVPGRYNGTVRLDESCRLLAKYLTMEPGVGDVGNYGGAISEGGNAANQAQASAPAAGELFPWPRPGELIFRAVTPFNSHVERYAGFRFIAIENNRLKLSRSAWEGPLSAKRDYVDQVLYVADEAIGRTGFGTCSVTASDQQLRQIAVGAKLNYRRDCTYSFDNGSGSRSTSTIERVVLRREQVTVDLGTFDAFVVRKTTRTISRSIARDGQETVVETSENEGTRWWAPALGFYVKDQSRSRIVSRTFAPRYVESHRQDNVPLPPTSTPWQDGTALFAISKR